MATILKLLDDARQALSGPDVQQESAILLEEICGISRTEQFTRPRQALAADNCEKFYTALKRRIAGEPLAYIIGSRGFWDMQLKVTPDVLIPRPDTECLVEQALLRIPENANWKIADLGTGSGAIALAIARERPHSELVATELSDAALSIAQDNATFQHIDNICFSAGSWLQAVGEQKFEMIVSNPPYISTSDPHLLQGDLPSEPQCALVSGEDGLEAIRKIISGSARHLKPGGVLLLEHGYDQAQKVTALLDEKGYVGSFSEKDYGDNDRVSGATWIKY